MQTRISNKMSRQKEYREWISLAKSQTGKGWFDQMREIRALRNYGGQCGISDYFGYKLYDDDYQMGRGASDFLGWRLQQKFSLALNPRFAVLPAWDKCVFTQLAVAAGLPVAPVRACYHPADRIADSLGVHLRTKTATAVYLRNPSLYPLFAKPAYSQQGFGSAYLAGYDPASDMLILLDGQKISIDDFLKRLDESVDHRYHKPECGFVFQECFALAPEIRALTNWSAICGVRIICLNGPEGVKPILAVWKIAVPPNHVDNFSLGKYGNLRAVIDLNTGEVSRMVGAFWPNSRVLTELPYSGKSVAGFKLPGWNLILDACKRGGAAFPLMKIQYWDFALTDKGPMILELNDLGGTIGEQIHGCGLLTEETREFLKRNGNTQEHPWIRLL
jgi:hypothetical protein